MKMSDIKFPTFSHYAVTLKKDGKGNPIYDGKMTNPSSLINYLGFKGTRLNKEYATSAPIATNQNETKKCGTTQISRIKGHISKMQD